MTDKNDASAQQEPLSSTPGDQEQLDEAAEKLVEAALNGDAGALWEIVSALDDEDEAIVDDDTQRADVIKAAALTLYRRANESPERVVADAALDPATRAAMAEHELLRGRFLQEPLDVNALVDVLREQVRRVTDKDLDRGAGMLAAQAHTLDCIYNDLLRKALKQEHAAHLEMFFKLALRAQSQCRATWEAISAIQNPPIAGYVKQANIANNQQVNNGSFDTSTRAAAHPRTRANETAPNKLLEQTTHEPDQWMDRGAPAAATDSNPSVGAVAAVDRTQDSGGESSRRP